MKTILRPVAVGLLFAVATSTTLAANGEGNSQKEGQKPGIASDKQAYLDQIASKIVTNYSAPGGFDVVQAKIGFELDVHGNVDHLRLLDDDDAPAEGQSSLTRTVLIKAIKKSAPFPSPGPVKKSLKLVAFFKKTTSEQPVACTVQLK